jgi:hypothetical protein
MAVFFALDKEPEQVKPASGQYFTLDELQQYVGGLIQIVPLRDKPPEWAEKIGVEIGGFAVMDEEGKVKGKAINFAATKALFPKLLDVIVGDALWGSLEEIE